MGALDGVTGRLVENNNRRVRRADGSSPGFRNLDRVPWHHSLAQSVGAIGEEWDRFEDAGGRLPRIEAVLDESQGNEGTWSVGLLVTARSPVRALVERFPVTVAALGQMPGLRSAMWSVLAPGAELPLHSGPNAGVLRYHLGVRCPPGAGIEVGGRAAAFEEGGGLLFDDTDPHRAWNRGDERRVTLFCEILRPLPRATALLNRGVQTVLGFDRRYRLAPSRALEWDRALNPAR